MFDPAEIPRVFSVPLGVDFPAALIRGLTDRFAGQSPERMAHVRLIVNTHRMARRIRSLFDAGPARLLPRVDLVTDLDHALAPPGIPEAASPLRRRLEILQLVTALIDKQPDLAPRGAIYDLADSLAGLMDEMHGEGVPPERIGEMDIADQSGHWGRLQAFLGIVLRYMDRGETPPDTEARQRMVVEALMRQWAETPPDYPVILAGSTGSRGATYLLMQAVSRLPQGAVILPGFDRDMPDDVWAALDDPMLSEDHPQFRYARLMRELSLSPADIGHWSPDAPANPGRNRIVSLALRPVPVTDQWRRDGPRLTGIGAAMSGVTLVEAPSARIEALTIAMRLRQCAEEGRSAALITPDRTLGRQVTAALDRWQIRPDDSAGTPLHLTPPGRFLRHVGELFHLPLSAEALLALLKHPLTHSGTDRGPHLRLTRELELHLRRYGPPYPDTWHLRAWAAGMSDPLAGDWAEWLIACFTGQQEQAAGEVPLAERVSRHTALAERIAQGMNGDGSGRLWDGDDGMEAAKCVSELGENAVFAGAVNPRDYTTLFRGVLSRTEARSAVVAHPLIRIWGTLEARVQGVDLLILAGLNEGCWPAVPQPDPWLNRDMRARTGMLLPERRVGLSAHDFQQGMLAPEVWLARSVRSDDAETVPARWLNRLKNLLNGLTGQGGPEAVRDMVARGAARVRLAEAFEATARVPPAPRPSPPPPVAARPRRLSVTEVKTLIRDPYAIYARHVLGLRPLDPLMKVPDALLRGEALHKVLENFVHASSTAPEQVTREALLAETVNVLAQRVPWAEARALWQARLEQVADRFVADEIARRRIARPALFEVRGTAGIEGLDFSLTAKADRIDIDQVGHLHLYDYKTGAPPTAQQQRHFDKQLLLEAAIAERSGFGTLAPAPVARAVFISLARGKPDQEAPLETNPPSRVWAEFRELIAAYMARDLGYTSRRAMARARDTGDYDQLARYGEWDVTDLAAATEVGP